MLSFIGLLLLIGFMLFVIMSNSILRPLFLIVVGLMMAWGFIGTVGSVILGCVVYFDGVKPIVSMFSESLSFIFSLFC